MIILYKSGLSTIGQGDARLEWSCPQGYHMIATSFQHCLIIDCLTKFDNKRLLLQYREITGLNARLLIQGSVTVDKWLHWEFVCLLAEHCKSNGYFLPWLKAKQAFIIRLLLLAGWYKGNQSSRKLFKSVGQNVQKSPQCVCQTFWFPVGCFIQWLPIILFSLAGHFLCIEPCRTKWPAMSDWGLKGNQG